MCGTRAHDADGCAESSASRPNTVLVTMAGVVSAVILAFIVRVRARRRRILPDQIGHVVFNLHAVNKQVEEKLEMSGRTITRIRPMRSLGATLAGSIPSNSRSTSLLPHASRMIRTSSACPSAPTWHSKLTKTGQACGCTASPIAWQTSAKGTW